MSVFDYTFDATFTAAPAQGIYGSFEGKAGVIAVNIIDGGDNEPVEITGISNLKYEFDLVPDQPEITAVQALYQKIDIEIFQHGYSNVDLYERLVDNIVANGSARVNLYVDSYKFSFFINVNDIELKDIDRVIKIECRVLYDDTTTVLDVFDNIPNSLIEEFMPDSAVPNEVLQSTGVLDWVDQAMKEVFLNTYPSIVLSSETGLGPDYNRTNYTSIEGDQNNERVGFIMANIEGDDFDTYGEYDGFGDTVVYQGNNKFKGKNLFAKIKAGDRFRLVRDNLTPLLDNVLIVSVDSDTEFTSAELNPSATVNEGQKYRWLYKPLINTQQFKAVEALQELAAMEGAIFGTGFGRNFFVNRVLHQEIVDIPWTDVIDIAPKPFWNEFGKGSVTQIARTYTDAENQTLNEGYDNFGLIPTTGGSWDLPLITDGKVELPNARPSDYSINLSLPPGYPFLNKAKWQPDNNRFLGKYDTPVSWRIDFEPTLALCRAGLKAMKKALASDGNSLYVEITAFDSGRVKPWNLFRIVDSVNEVAPEKYRNKIFRSTNIEYDFIKDIASYEAYEILEDDIQDPGLNISVKGVGTTSGQVEFVVNEKTFINASGTGTTSGSVTYTVNKTVSATGTATTANESVSTGTGKGVQVSGVGTTSGSVTTNVQGNPIPTNVNLILNTTFSLVTWDQPSNGQPDNYEVQYKINGGNWNVLDASVAGTESSKTFDACALGSNSDTFVCRVRAIYPTVTSDFAETLQGTLTDCI